MNKLKAAALVELGNDPLQGRTGPTKAGDLHKQSEHVKEWRGELPARSPARRAPLLTARALRPSARSALVRSPRPKVLLLQRRGGGPV